MGDQGLILIGSSHQTAPLDLLESLALTPEEVREMLPALREELGLDEVMVLSTCNRTEVYGLAQAPEETAKRLMSRLIELSANRSAVAAENLYSRADRDAVEHLFRVACGLDSLILGETEITGQVQRAFELSREVGTAGSFLTQLLSATFRACKRARSETGINAGTTSVASAAVHLARRVFGDLDRREVAVVGAGETGTLAARYFRQHTPRTLYLANRTHERAEALAAEVDGTAIPLEDWVSLLSSVDAVVLATHSKTPLITAEMVRGAARDRSSRMLLIIDVSLPRNAEQSVGEIDNVLLYDMYDLKKIVEQNVERRALDVPAVESILESEMHDFFGLQATLEVGPVIRELRERFEVIRRKEIERFKSRFSEDDQPVAERLTRDMVNKLLHWPTLGIRALAQDNGSSAERLAWARRLFGLDRPEGKGERE
ncbi:MAG: glutamyl-tRNA reductase [Deltaproteobacteria bacterium]|nr:glutamyl-tRNA reductase [Deltaproteobacteria bacterium]